MLGHGSKILRQGIQSKIEYNPAEDVLKQSITPKELCKYLDLVHRINNVWVTRFVSDIQMLPQNLNMKILTTKDLPKTNPLKE